MLRFVKRSGFPILALALISVAVVTPSAAREKGVQATVDEIRETLASQGFQIEATIDHAAAAASVGLELAPTQVVLFGNDRADLGLIRRRQRVALDLPLRFLVYQDESGKTQVRSHGTGYLTDRHRLPTRDWKLLLLGNVLRQFENEDRGIRRVRSRQSVSRTVDTLLGVLEERGFRIPLVIDYAARTPRFGTRPTTLVVFGNPRVGTPLMQSQREIALDLPQKMLVYRDYRGRVRLAYNDPFFLATQHNVVGQDERLRNIAAALRGIALEAASATPEFPPERPRPRGGAKPRGRIH